MRKPLTIAVGLMWAALLLGGAFRPPLPPSGTAARPDVGYTAPPLTARDMEGRPVSLDALRGKAVFLNFWASWCPPCRLEMPEIEALSHQLPANAVLLTVNMTSQESSVDAVRQFLAGKGYTFPVALDPTGDTGRAYRVVSLPTSLFIGPDGRITARINGPLSGGAMLDYLKAAGRVQP